MQHCIAHCHTVPLLCAPSAVQNLRVDIQPAIFLPHSRRDMYIPESSQTLLHDPVPSYDDEQPILTREILARDSADAIEISETAILHLSAVSGQSFFFQNCPGNP